MIQKFYYLITNIYGLITWTIAGIIRSAAISEKINILRRLVAYSGGCGICLIPYAPLSFQVDRGILRRFERTGPEHSRCSYFSEIRT